MALSNRPWRRRSRRAEPPYLPWAAKNWALASDALVAVVVPLIVLAVPFLDTTFVVLKRMKYRRPVYLADTNHFHHRFSRIGFSHISKTGLL